MKKYFVHSQLSCFVMLFGYWLFALKWKDIDNFPTWFMPLLYIVEINWVISRIIYVVNFRRTK